MKIVQMLPVLRKGDAIGNEALEIRRALLESGRETEIYTEHSDESVPAGVSKNVSEFEDGPDVLILYHLSTYAALNDRLADFRAHVVLIYHNITPPEFFTGYDALAERVCRRGLEQVKKLKDRAELVLADSAFNQKCLTEMGYTCPIEVLPVLVRTEVYTGEPDKKLLDQYADDGTVKILFVGRIAPNKKQNDLIESFYEYHTYINPASRLFLPGFFEKRDAYPDMLRKLIRALDLEESVLMPGAVPFADILAFYRMADVVVCLSEHEGFCVPVLEAMVFHKPVIAYDSTAVGETLGGSGILLPDKRPQVVAEAIARVTEDASLREEIVRGEEERLADFAYDKIRDRLFAILDKYFPV